MPIIGVGVRFTIRSLRLGIVASLPQYLGCRMSVEIKRHHYQRGGGLT
jgi:hypothetical protein